MTKKILIGLSILAVLLTLLIYAVVYSRWFPAFALNQWLKMKYPDVTLESLSFKERNTSWHRVSFKDLTLTLEQKGLRWNIRLPEFQVVAPRGFFNRTRDFQVMVKRGEIVRDPFQLKDFSLDLNLQKLESGRLGLSGQWSGDSMVWDNYAIQNPQSTLSGDTGNVRLPDFSARGYGGKIQGEILLDFISMLSYDIYLEIDDVQSAQLKTIHETIFSQFNGQMSGTFRINGSGGAIKDFSADLQLGEGSEVRAQFLKMFTQYIPDVLQKDLLKEAIAKDENLPIRSANLKLRNVGEDKLAFNVDLDSSIVHLENSTVDINLDAPIMSLMHLLEILKQVKFF